MTYVSSLYTLFIILTFKYKKKVKIDNAYVFHAKKLLLGVCGGVWRVHWCWWMSWYSLWRNRDQSPVSFKISENDFKNVQ